MQKVNGFTGELYVAWLKDIGEKDSDDNKKLFRSIYDSSINEKEIVMRNQRVGLNMVTSITTILLKSTITKLDLYHNCIYDSGCEPISHFLHEDNSLTYLNLGANGITAIGCHTLANALSAHPAIQTIILGSEFLDPYANKIDFGGIRFILEKLCCSKTLRLLNLNCNSLANAPAEIYNSFCHLIQKSTTLQGLSLAETEISTKGALRIIEAVSKSGSLVDLDFSRCKLSMTIARHIGKLIEEKSQRAPTGSMRTLCLNGNPNIGPEGAKTISLSLLNNKSLTQLSMQNCGVDDEALFALCKSLETDTALTILELQSNNITGEGAFEFARSAVRHPAITHIGLGHNKIKDDGVCALASMLELNKKVRFIDLTDTWTSDRGLIALGVALANNTSLETLKLSNNHISDDGATAFNAILDKNKVITTCNLKSNNIGYGTIIQTEKILNRNRQYKANEGANELHKELIKLHYQMYKLEEAKAELALQQEERTKVERATDEFDQKVRMEEADFKKKQKELLEQITTWEAQARAADNEYETIIESYRRYESEYEIELTQLKLNLTTSTEDRQVAETAYKSAQAMVKAQERNERARLEKVREKIAHSLEEKEKWEAQGAEYRRRIKEMKVLLDGGSLPPSRKSKVAIVENAEEN